MSITHSKKLSWQFIAVLMAVMMFLGAVPIHVFAQDKSSNANEPTALTYIHIDGEKIAITDERIINSQVVRNNPRQRSVVPNVTNISSLSAEFTGDPSVFMNSTRVSAIRYIVTIDGVEYEAFCADPQLRGPENPAAAYELSGEAHPRLLNALRNGYPLNTAWSTLPNLDDRLWYVYVTRVAVAMANYSNANFTGDSAIRQRAEQLASGAITADHTNTPALMVNGTTAASDIRRTISDPMATSEIFTVSYNRKSNMNDSPFRFEWDGAVPSGTLLIVNGTALTDFSQVFRGDVEFKIHVPNTPENDNVEVKVNLVGIHNEFANRIWMMQNASSPETWQDIVFFIHESKASALFSFSSADEYEAALRIIKRNPAGSGLAGAVFNITGPNGFEEARTTPSNGQIVLTDLAPGEYTITEISPPPGHQLADPVSVAVNIPPNSTEVIERVFINEPYENGGEPEPRTSSVRIQKIDAMSRENIPGAMVRLVGMSANYITLPDGQTISFNNTGINLMQVLTEGATVAAGDDVISTVTDGVWTLEGLPYGFYMVYEYRAPDGYSLLPAHTARGFWLAPPNWNIGIEMPDFELEWNANESESTVNWNLGDSSGNMGAGGDPEAGWQGEGSVTIPGSDMSPPDFVLEEQPNLSSVLITFENFPFSEVVINKREASNGIGNNQPLAGAHFRIQGFFVEGNSPQVIDRTGVTDSSGRLVFSDLPAGAYTVTEIAPPSGYLLGDDTVWHVNVGWGQTVARGTAPTHTFFNIPKSSLEVLKIDGMTNAVLQGAVFELSDPTTGETWQSTTGANGIAVFGRGNHGNFLYPGRTYILREITAPNGYILMNTTMEVVLSPGDANRITWHNYHNPSLTIIKRDAATHEHLAGAVFDVTFENGQPIPGSPFTTYNQGRIVIPQILGDNERERTVIVTETSPPPGYNLANPNWQRVTIRAGEDNVVTFDNERMPYLEIIKLDAVTGQPIPGAWFEIEYLGATSGTGSGNIGNSGLLTGNPFITDSNGRIRIPHQHSGRYRIREIRAANGYWLDPLEQNRTWIIEIRDNEDYTLVVENTMLPTLVVRKRNAITWQGIYMTRFRVEYEVPNSPNRQLIGYFNTDRQGYIIIPFVDVGWYAVTEVRAAPGMTLPTNPVQRIFLRPGDNTYQYIGAIRDLPGISRESHPTLMWPQVEAQEPPTSEPTPPTEQQPQRPELTPELMKTILQILDMLRQMRA